MNFIYPNFLWASLFVAIPIIIHLFYFRRYKKVYFSNTAILNEVKNEKSSKNKLKHLLVLFSRLFAILFLVMAFAQPYLISDDSGQANEKNVSLYIDNSFSMKAEGNGQLLFDEAKESAEFLINTFSENDKFQILTNDFDGKHQRLVNKMEAKRFLNDLQISPSIRSSKTVFERQKSVFTSQSADNIIFQFSDFQKNNELFISDSNYTTNIVKHSSVDDRNVLIDSVWLDNSFQLKDAMTEMIVLFRNESDEKVEGNYQLLLNNDVKSIGEFKIDKHSSAMDTVIFKTSQTEYNTGKIQISDYPITFDDSYYYSFYVEEKINVLAVSESESNNIFKAVFKDVENVNFENSIYNSLNYNDLSQQHFIILNQIETLPSGLIQNIKDYIEQGGSIFLIPHKKMSVASYNVLLSNLNIGSFTNLDQTKRDVTKINMDHVVLKDIFESYPENIKLPKVQKAYQLRSNVNSIQEQILSFSNNESFLSSFQFARGTVYIINSPLEKSFTDVTANALFAPIVYKMAILGVNNPNISNEINGNTLVKLKKRPANFEDVLKLSNENIETIPQRNIFGNELILSLKHKNLESGIYELTNENNTYQSKVALNYSRKESILDYYSKSELEKLFPDRNVNIIMGNKIAIQDSLLNNSKGNSLWKWFIAFSLLFLAFEILLLRFLKN